MRVFLVTLALTLLALPALAQVPDLSTAPRMFAVQLRMAYGEDGSSEASMAALGQHVAYLQQLYRDGKLYMAGPFDDESGAGLAVLSVGSQEEAQQIVANDPSVKAGFMQVVSVNEWVLPINRGEGYAFGVESADDDDDPDDADDDADDAEDDADEDGDEQMMESIAGGQIVHLEFHSNDLERTKAFYSSLFDWTFQDMPMEGVEYTLFMDGGDKLGGGFMGELPVGGALTYIFVEDIEAKLEQIDAAGGSTVQGKTEIPQVGFYAIFTDPSGNTLGLFSNQ